MKKALCMLLALCLFLPLCGLAEEEELSMEEMEESVDLDALGEGEIFQDDETGEIYFLTAEEQEKYEALLEEEEEEDTGIDPNALSKNPNLPDNVINILLIGVDTRSKDPQEIVGRGDTQIILSVNKDTGAVKMASILRDSYVTVSGFGKNSSKDKINTTFQRGCNQVKKGTVKEKTRSGAARAMRAVNYNFEMNIENYVAINFNGLASIIDALGGIEIELTKAEASYINSYLAKHPPAYDNKAKGERVKLEQVSGVQLLDGVQAVMYARIRSIKGENDFNRTDRQRHLLDLLLQKVIANMDFGTLMDLIDVAVTYSDTNMNFQTIFELARSLLPSLSKIQPGESLFEQMRIPIEKSYAYKTINGASVVSFSVAKQAEALHQFIYGSYIPAK